MVSGPAFYCSSGDTYGLLCQTRFSMNISFSLISNFLVLLTVPSRYTMVGYISSTLKRHLKKYMNAFISGSLRYLGRKSKNLNLNYFNNHATRSILVSSLVMNSNIFIFLTAPLFYQETSKILTSWRLFSSLVSQSLMMS